MPVIITRKSGTGNVSIGAILPPGSSGPAPWVLEDFSTYVSTADMINDPRVIYSTGEDIFNPGEIVLDQTVGVNTFGFNLSQSMKYVWPNNGSTCAEQTIGRNLMFPGDTHGSPQSTLITELWLDVIHKFQNGFVTDVGASGCAAAYKFVFGRCLVSRFQLVVGIFGGDYTWGYPNNEEPSDVAMPWTPFDGNWHRYQMHWKIDTSAGIATLLIDGTLTQQLTGLAMPATNLWGVALGRNMNEGPNQIQSEWWGRVAMYNTNPGWGI